MMKNSMLKLLLICCFLVTTKLSMAQTIQVIMSPKPSPFISDWISQSETIKLVITNGTGAGNVVRLKTELFDGNKNLIATTDYKKMADITIPPNPTPLIFDATEVIPLEAIEYKGKLIESTAKTGKIPEGNYTLCVSLVSRLNGQPVGSGGTVCKPFNIISYQAPVLTLPINNATIMEKDGRGIMFRWTPIIPKPRDPVLYRLNIWEVLEGQTPMIAIRTNQPIVTKDIKNLLQTQWPIENSMPEAGSTYAWSITPLNIDEQKMVDGLGMAEPLVFTIQPNTQTNASITLISPANAASLRADESKDLAFRWTPIIPKPRDPVTYRMKVWQLMQGQNNVEAMRSNKPLVLKENLTEPTFIKANILGDVEMIDGKALLVWQAEAVDEKGNLIGKSEPSLFNIIEGSQNVTVKNDILLLNPPNYSKINNLDGSVNFKWEYPNVKIDHFRIYIFEKKSGKSTPEVNVNQIALIKIDNTLNEVLLLNKSFFDLIKKKDVATFIWKVEGLNFDNKVEISSKFYEFSLPFISPLSCTCQWLTSYSYDILNPSGFQLRSGTVQQGGVIPISTNEYVKLSNISSPCIGCNGSILKYDLFKPYVGCGDHILMDSNNFNSQKLINSPCSDGCYSARIKAVCNGTIQCGSFNFCIKKTCPSIDCCKGGKWIPPFLTAPMPTAENPLNYIITNPANGTICGKEIQNVKCNSYINFRYAYQCATNCKATITYVFKNGTTNEVLNTFSNIENSRNLAFLTPNVSGYYCMTAYVKCGDKICDSCTVCFKLDCPPPVDCCKNSVWGIKKVNGSIINCNGTLPGSYPINTIVTTNFIYNCNTASSCSAKIKYVVKNTLGQIVGTPVFVSSGVNASVQLPNTSGRFCIVAYAYCGTSVIPCDSCNICFNVTCLSCGNIAIPCNISSVGKFTYLQGSIPVNTGKQIKSVMVELASASVTTAPTTFTNVEFYHPSTSIKSNIGGAPVLFPMSLSLNRSNIAISNFSGTPTSVAYNLYVTNSINKYRIKFTIIYTDGTYCEITKFN